MGGFENVVGLIAGGFSFPLLVPFNNQQTQPTRDAESGNRTQATLVGGECSHHCAIPAPLQCQNGKLFKNTLLLPINLISFLPFFFLKGAKPGEENPNLGDGVWKY